MEKNPSHNISFPSAPSMNGGIDEYCVDVDIDRDALTVTVT